MFEIYSLHELRKYKDMIDELRYSGLVRGELDLLRADIEKELGVRENLK